MRALRSFLFRATDWLFRRRRERELAAELESHLALHEDDNLRDGFSPNDARRLARLRLGAIESVKDQYRDRRGLPFVEEFVRDLGLAWRLMRHSPGFSAVALTALAIGTGSNVAIFSLANSVILRPMPVANPSDIVRIYSNTHSMTPFASYQDYRAASRMLDGLAAFQGVSLSLRAGAEPEHVFGMVVSGNYFQVLGVPAALGRPITPADDTRGAPGVVVLSDRAWRRRFGADPRIIGTSLSVNGQPYQVVGVAPAAFNGTMVPLAPEMWVPMHGAGLGVTGDTATDESGPVHMIGRRQAGVAVARVQAEFDVLAANIAAQNADGGPIRARVAPARTLADEIGGGVTAFLTLLSTVVGLVLLVACVNLANLMLARAAARRREMAVRLALGASRGRLMRQLLTESGLMASLGTGAGFCLAAALLRVATAVELPTPVPIVLDLAMDWRVVSFAVALSCATALLFGSMPAWQASRTNMTPALKDGTPGSGRVAWRFRAALLTTQVAVSTVLLVVGAVLGRSLTSAEAADLGFDNRRVLAASFDLATVGETPATGRQFLEALIDRLNAAPGVDAASVVEIVPVTISNKASRFVREGQGLDPGAAPLVLQNSVTPGHFDTLGISMIAGRDFSAADRVEATPVGVVNETLARTFWPDEGAVGKRLRLWDGPDRMTPWIEIIGIAKDSKYATVGEPQQPFLYQPLAQDYHSALTLLVRSPADPMQVVPIVRAVVRDLNPDLPLFNISPLAAANAVSLLPVQVAAWISGVLGAVALVLAALGLYGVMTYVVRQRTTEIGLRIALGARPSEVVRYVTRQGMRWTLVGLGLGLAASFALTRLLSSLLYGIGAADAVSFIGMTALLLASSYTACYVPGRRASRMDPLQALRHD